jgi:hypothetical protein
MSTARLNKYFSLKHTIIDYKFSNFGTVSKADSNPAMSLAVQVIFLPYSGQ